MGEAGQGVRDSKVSFEFFFFEESCDKHFTLRLVISSCTMDKRQSEMENGEDLVIVLYLN